MKVKFANKIYDCIRAEKHQTTAILYLTDGDIVEFAGINDWNLFSIEDGEEWSNQTFEEIQTEKLSSLSEACNQTIVAGMDVETTEGVEHFSLEETDQINLTTALSAIEQGAKGYPYHADKKLCRMFTAVEIKAIAEKATAHKLYHTTLCNHLLILARRATTTAELDEITYSADCLPLDLAQNMQKVLVASGVTE